MAARQQARPSWPIPCLRILSSAGTVATLAMSGFMALLASTPATAASCDAATKEFALLASIGMRDETVKSWKNLPAACRKALAQSGTPPPTNASPDTILQYGAQIHAWQKDSHGSRLQQPLASADIPQVDQRALAGIGPDNLSRAMGGMLLDLAAAGLSSRQRHDQAGSVRALSDAVLGDEQREWQTAHSTTGAGIAGIEGVNPRVPSDPPADITHLPVPDSVNSASCQGDFTFLAPVIPDYHDPMLRTFRTGRLAYRVQEAVHEVRSRTQNKNHAIQVLYEHIRIADSAAAHAKHQADSMDGRGDQVSTREVDNNAKTIALRCGQEPSIHAAGVCEYIVQRIHSLMLRSTVELVKRC